MYKVISEFDDLQDGKSTKNGMIYHHYKVGDTFPRDGKTVDESRLYELSGKDNLQGIPLIKEVTKPAPAKKHKVPAKAAARTVHNDGAEMPEE